MKDSAPAPQQPEKEFNPFDFATESTRRLTLDYGDMGGIRTSVYFEVYDAMPVALNASGTAYVPANEGMTPLYAGYTDAQGRFTGSIRVPSYASRLYVYTPAFYAQTLLEAELANDAYSAAAVSEAPETASATRAAHESRVVTRDGWKTWLGDYDQTYGRIEYVYTGSKLRVEDYDKLYKAHASVFDTSKSCPEGYRSWCDMYIDKDAHVAVTLLGGNTCWTSSMGYYYYKEGQKPASLADAHIIMIYPNTQDGQWSVNRLEALRHRGVSRGTAVQLKFFPRIAEGSKEGAQDWFPKGYRIGFVLATNAWTNRLKGFGGDKQYRAATSEGFSIDDKGAAYQVPRTAVFRYIDKKNEIDAVLFSFEDYKDDENFSDVVFTMVSDPLDAVIDIPEVEVDDTKKTSRTLRGIYGFEDLWPSKGDYDLNDVMVRSNYEKTFSEKGIYQETFLMTTFSNCATIENGLAVRLGDAASKAELSCAIQRKGSQVFEKLPLRRENDGVVVLTDNVKDDMGATYRIVAEYASPIEESQATVATPFIFNTSYDNLTAGCRVEVHIPYDAPTELVEKSLFGTSDDRSILSKGIYYVREGRYPFAFFLAGATDKDVVKMLAPENESEDIDLLYPAYKGWVESNGTKNQNWYKQ